MNPVHGTANSRPLGWSAKPVYPFHPRLGPVMAVSVAAMKVVANLPASGPFPNVVASPKASAAPMAAVAPKDIDAIAMDAWPIPMALP